MDFTGKKWTIEEGIEEAIARENGTNEYIRDDNDYKKIGDIRTCHKCKKPVDVLMHDLFELDAMSITFCDNCSEYEDHLDKMGDGQCMDDKGRVMFDGKKYKEESMELHLMILKIKNAVEEIKPRNDSILEYDRTRQIIEHGCFAHGYGKTDTHDRDWWIYREFISYMALNGKLTLTK